MANNMNHPFSIDPDTPTKVFSPKKLTKKERLERDAYIAQLVENTNNISQALSDGSQVRLTCNHRRVNNQPGEDVFVCTILNQGCMGIDVECADTGEHIGVGNSLIDNVKIIGG